MLSLAGWGWRAGGVCVQTAARAKYSPPNTLAVKCTWSSIHTALHMSGNHVRTPTFSSGMWTRLLQLGQSMRKCRPALLGRCRVQRSVLQVSLLIPASLTAPHLLRPALCKQRPPTAVSSRLLVTRSHDQDVAFDWTKFWEYLSPEWFWLLLAVATALVAAMLNIQIPLELGNMVQVVAVLAPGQSLDTYIDRLAGPGLRLCLLYLTQGVFTFLYISVLSHLGERFAVRLRTALFHSLIQQDIAFFDSHKTGELVNRLTADVQDFKSSFKMVISQGLRGITQTIGCFLSLYLISPQMTGLVGVSLPVMIGIGSVVGTVLRRWSRQAQEQVAVATGVADEALGNVRTVRAFAMEDREVELYSRELQSSQWHNQRLGLGIAGFQSLSNIAINGMVLAVVTHGGMLMATNQISPGNLMSFLLATQTIQRSLGSLSVLFGQVVKGLSSGSRVFQYIASPLSSPLRGGHTLPAEEVRGRVEFRDVQFSYPNRPNQVVLDDLSLTLPEGKVTALCGLSGAGKSTVAALLERFYEPKGGRIYLDETPIDELDSSWLREEVVGFINQEPVLFATTVLENIRYGRPSASDEEVYEAARHANADNFIRAFPDGYGTVVGERGHAVSGGQKQRIAIARALLKNPRILILDEATSALDAHSEKLVQEALDRVSQGRTVLVIAHRLSTIQDADCIAVLHRGKLRELGSHKELLHRGGLYAELIRRQTQAFQ